MGEIFGVTPRQAQVLTYLQQRQEAGGPAPSLREIAAGIGSKSTGHVAEFVAGLEARGLIRRIPGGKRSIALVEQPARPVAPPVAVSASGITFALRLAIVAEEIRNEMGLSGAQYLEGISLLAGRTAALDTWPAALRDALARMNLVMERVASTTTPPAEVHHV